MSQSRSTYLPTTRPFSNYPNNIFLTNIQRISPLVYQATYIITILFVFPGIGKNFGIVGDDVKMVEFQSV